ncbi:putative C6 finger domain protein [Dothidotthia symphoricarpi CBS 119687]|uniref:Putative C6 finger domain protein n=1 Tax=Dothidotthia symphoricarpi CBS 119687 TaxID=1392245 RepID=A0A6A6A543_9PLEO|nr:putative C6 finger domain protein [Dothidotthia symphoricarpi CBS 119687]KAF2126293.1 putative C6 finger domain protein [Dothidotthia symphoricarpi CBS 119687]
MLRRSHKKSRGGCLECKRRHIKCDEQRPICLLCIRSERECSYGSRTSRDSRSAEHSPSQNGYTSSNTAQSQTGTPSTPASISDVDSNVRNVRDDRDLPPDDAVNMNHMELVAHITLDNGMFNLGVGMEWYHPAGLSLALKTGLEAPFLMHQLLAFSARHLAFLYPERSTLFLHQAMTLQTRAISLFNSTWAQVDHSNCVSVLLFSSVLGHHLLADTLAKRETGGLDAFVKYYAHCAGMQRGVVAVAKSAWPLLMESELEPILSLSSAFTSRAPTGTHCQRAMELIESANNLDAEDRAACRLAVHYLQVGLDAVLSEEEQGNQYQMVFSWTTLMAPEFMGLLTSKRPEALVVMAYYALLLHHGRSMWQVGDAGAYIMGIISDYLGSEWDHWLEYPRQEIAKDTR